MELIITQIPLPRVQILRRLKFTHAPWPSYMKKGRGLLRAPSVRPPTSTTSSILERSASLMHLRQGSVVRSTSWSASCSSFALVSVLGRHHNAHHLASAANERHGGLLAHGARAQGLHFGRCRHRNSPEKRSKRNIHLLTSYGRSSPENLSNARACGHSCAAAHNPLRTGLSQT